jgi:hypothetical protein
MSILKSWKFWVVLFIMIIIAILIFYPKNVKTSSQKNKTIESNYNCSLEGCVIGCSNDCITFKESSVISCPEPAEEYECKCENNKCVKTNK